MAPVELELPAGASRTAYRGSLRVRLVRADPESAEIGVDVWRFPAAEGVPKDRPPIFQLHGGPGWPGLQPERIDWERQIAPLVAHADLVIVGQRGIGTSEPDTSCDRFASGIAPGLPENEEMAALAEACKACRAHWESQGYDLRGFNVIEAAADVDDARRLLGYDEIVVMGGSFGSHWGMAVMRFHSEAVARAVLHGMEGPDHTYDSPHGILAALERIAAQAEASPRLEGRLPEEGLIEALRTVIRDVEEDPFELEVGDALVRIDADGLRGLARGYEHRVNSRETVGGWPRDVVRLFEGDFEPVARALARQRSSGGGLPTASFFQLDCGSGITRERLERYTTDPAIEVVGDLAAWYEALCPAWDADLGEDFRAGFTTDIPTLVVQGTWDVSTPYENAVEMLPSFEDVHFVSVEGGTHGAFREAMGFDPAFEEAVMAFVAEGTREGLPAEIVLPPIEWMSGW